MGIKYDRVTRVIANPLTQLTFPLITAVLDYFRHLDNSRMEDMRNYLKGPALAGAFVGAGFGIALCSPGGLTKVMYDHGILHADFPIDKMSDLFNVRGGFSQLDSSGWDAFCGDALKDDFLNVFLCILTIAACAIVFKTMAAGIGYYSKKMAVKTAETANKGKKMPNPVEVGLLYGFFGDSSKDVRALWKFITCSSEQASQLGRGRGPVSPKGG